MNFSRCYTFYFPRWIHRLHPNRSHRTLVPLTSKTTQFNTESRLFLSSWPISAHKKHTHTHRDTTPRTHSLSSERFTLKSGHLVRHRGVFCRQLRTDRSGKAEGMPLQGASHGQTFWSRRPNPFKANLGKRISWRLQKPVPVPSTLACQIGPICRHHSLCRMHLRKQRFSAPPLKLCLSCRLSLHLLNNNFVCFFKENLQQQRRLRLAIEARDTYTLSVNDLKKNYCHHCHTKALFVPTAL